MIIKTLAACAALTLVGCASYDQGSSDSTNDRTYGTGSQTQTTATNAPHQGQAAEKHQSTPPN